MRAAVWAGYASIVLFWAPLALGLHGGLGDALAWWAGVLICFAGRLAGEVIHNNRGGNRE